MTQEKIDQIESEYFNEYVDKNKTPEEVFDFFYPYLKQLKQIQIIIEQSKH